MALAASRTTRLGVIEWNPSGIGFLAGAMITSPFYEFLGQGQFTLLPGSACERRVKSNTYHRGTETRRNRGHLNIGASEHRNNRKAKPCRGSTRMNADQN